jgi:hypothetical protein
MATDGDRATDGKHGWQKLVSRNWWWQTLMANTDGRAIGGRCTRGKTGGRNWWQKLVAKTGGRKLVAKVVENPDGRAIGG